MPAFLTRRPLTADEIRTLERLAHSRTEPARAVERAQIVWQAHLGARVLAIARAREVTDTTIRLWLRRFNAGGMDGLEDAPRNGRPPVYDATAVGAVIAASLMEGAARLGPQGATI